jgi:hypothetical protein
MAVGISGVVPCTGFVRPVIGFDEPAKGVDGLDVDGE